MSCNEQPCFALDSMFEGVVSYFEANNIKIPNHFGWREVNRHKTTESRIVWVPGDEGGQIGSIGAPRNTGQNPRHLAQVGELFTVYLSSFAKDNPEDEKSQYRESRRLFHLWYQAAHATAYGTFEVLDHAYDQSQKERSHGVMVVATVQIQAPIADNARAIAPADAEARILTTNNNDGDTSEEEPSIVPAAEEAE